MNILFVCTGNTCRSPMAAAIAREKLAHRDDVRIASAGTAASEATGRTSSQSTRPPSTASI